MTNEVNTVLQQLNTFNEQLIGAPAGVLVFLFVLALSYALRWWHLFPDRSVAPLSTFVGMVIYGLLAPYAQEHMRIWLAKSAAIGFVISFIASTLMLKFGERLPLIGRFLAPNGTKFITKSDVTNPP